MKNFSILIGILITVLLFTNSVNSQEKEVKKLTKTQQMEVIDSLAKQMITHYVFEDKANEVAKLIKSKKYSTSPDVFAKELYEDINSVINDGHFRVWYSPNSEKVAKKKVLTKEELEKRNKEYNERLKKQNYLFSKVEILPGNIGYIKFSGFQAYDRAFRAAAAAMQFIENTDAIIIDVRNNGGGDGRMGHFLSTYFFGEHDSRWLLNNYNRGQNKLVQEWTMPTVPGKRRPNVPLYILVNKRTYSAAEAFPYALQAQKRAIIVGETTGGGAHSIGRVYLAHDFFISLPSGRVTSPVTKSNWEGIGVIPEIKIESDKAIDKAIEDFLVKKLEKEENEKQKEELKVLLLKTKAKINPIKIADSILENYCANYIVKGHKHKTRRITKEDNKLYLTIIDGENNYGKFEISPIDEKTFLLMDGQMKIEFDKIENGRPQVINYSRYKNKEEWLRNKL